MKTTMIKLKDKVKRYTSEMPVKENDFCHNVVLINEMRGVIIVVCQRGADDPTRRYEVSDRQKMLLNNWVDNLETKFLGNINNRSNV